MLETQLSAPIPLPRGKVESVSDEGLVQMRLPDGNLLRRRIPLEQVPSVRKWAFGAPPAAKISIPVRPHG